MLRLLWLVAAAGFLVAIVALAPASRGGGRLRSPWLPARSSSLDSAGQRPGSGSLWPWRSRRFSRRVLGSAFPSGCIAAPGWRTAV